MATVDKNQIKLALTTLSYIHPLLIDEIEKHGVNAMDKLSNENAKILLGNSIHVISRIADGIIESENLNDGWREIMRTSFENMSDSFKDFYRAYFQENNVNIFASNGRGDVSMNSLVTEFYHRTKDDMYTKGISNPYSWVIRYIGEYRNRTKHDNQMNSIPIDPITSMPTHGNLYTLISSYCLGLYAFLELVRYWDSSL